MEDLGARNEENKGGDWKTMVGRSEEQLWREGMEKSKGSLEVEREVVKRRGEMKEWKGLVEETKVWWRRFRGGMLIGKRRENKWSDERCMFCGGENGGMRHVRESGSGTLERECWSG